MTRGRKLGLLLLALAALLVLTIVVMELAPDGEGTEEATPRYNFYPGPGPGDVSDLAI